ncbi:MULTISPECIES: efflux RND transporter permease subunit [Helcococcus]|uniref:MMPL family transporter n=1 Tax=Helcococcus bovis TaxID=3153252 RepID=A0ABW9F5J8_9FIRM
MKKVARFLIKKNKSVILIFLILTIITGIMALGVKINFSLSKYLPEDSDSVISISKMADEYVEPIPNLRIMLKNVSVQDAIAYKNKLSTLPEVKLILWLDKFENTSKPIELMDKNLLDTYYKNNNALFQVAVKTNNSKESLDNIKRILKDDTAYDGELVSEAAAQNSTKDEISKITIFVLPASLLILLLAVKSWFEPIIIMIAIGVAIVINMGTNIFLKEVSFITQAVSGILQFAVSLDYGVFLLHEFKHQKTLVEDTDLALENAVVKSSSAVISSALTTIFGFIVLVFMRFGIGLDLGLVLAKGVIFSLFSVIFLLPAIIKLSMKLIDKTEHRDLLPNFNSLSKFVLKFRWLIIFVILIVPIAFIGQIKNDFTYGMGEFREDSIEGKDKKNIEKYFGKDIPIVLLVPKNKIAKEFKMIEELKNIDMVKTVQSYTEQVGNAIPIKIPPQEQIKSLISKNYSRIILNTTSESEGKTAFNLIDNIKNIVNKYYSDFEILGKSVVLQDMSKIIKKDNFLVNILAIISVALVILINFKSLILPLLLVFTIEASIWINLSLPYFTNTKLSFIGYLVISSIQLGATVDYAILYTNNYLENRKKMDKKDALIKASEKVYGSIIPPAMILITSGYVLSWISSIALVSELGKVLGRGGIFSLTLVIFLLPVLLYFFDSIVEKTTYKPNFKRKEY